MNNSGNAANSVITDVTKLGGCVLADPVASAAAGCVLVPGFEKDLSGNELPYAPEWSLKLAAQYTMPFLNTGYELTFRVDHYWQDEMYSRIFNDGPDKISSWSQTDAQIRLSSPGEPWMLEFWVKNIQDNDDVTGHYFTDENVRQLHEPVHSGAARHRRYAASRVLESFWTIPHGRSLARPAVLHQLHVGGLTGGTSGPCGRTRSRCSGPWQCEPQP